MRCHTLSKLGKERNQRCWGGRVPGKFKEHEDVVCGRRDGAKGRVGEKRVERLCVCVAGGGIMGTLQSYSK